MPEMILTVTLNSCLHEYLTFEDPDPARPVVRPVAKRWSSGGKGFNAARTVRALGGEVVAVGLAGGMHGALLRRCLEEEGVPAELVPTAADTRVSHCLFDRGRRRFREYLEAGVDATAAEAEALAATVEGLLPRTALLTLNGSSPGPVLDALFPRLVRAARSAGVPVVLDSYGAAAAQALAESPDWFRCNRDELRETFGLERAADLWRWWRERDLPGLLVSDGAGAVQCFGRAGAWHATPPAVTEVNPVGSGDALTGAFALALARERSPGEALAWGIAAGAANAERLEVGAIPEPRWRELLAQVRVEEA